MLLLLFFLLFPVLSPSASPSSSDTLFYILTAVFSPLSLLSLLSYHLSFAISSFPTLSVILSPFFSNLFFPVMSIEPGANRESQDGNLSLPSRRAWRATD
ncbi:hypothetical protein GGR54DRAFT_591882 [Hypoxylon sp. NC1633]|nr:hypothetical protein GGR54DRAFT_591882 [Hypoxylon sp. NC1633]